MPTRLRNRCLIVVVCFFASVSSARAQALFRYAEARHGKGELRYVGQIPVLIVRGTHAEMGDQIGHLALKPAAKIIDMVNGHAGRQIPNALRPLADLAVLSMFAKFPPEYRQEIEAMATAAGVDRKSLMMANTIIDLEEMVGCSSLIVNQARSTTGGPLYGRNVDMPYIPGLVEYSVLIVYHPDEGHAFAMPNLPGFLMLMSGMNAKGLALGSQSVGLPRDGSARFDPVGVASAVAGRRLMERCGDVEEAFAWLEQNRLVRCVSIAACDPLHQTVLEVTTKRVLSRGSNDGFVCATNHFRLAELGGNYNCPRYAILDASRRMARMGVKDVAAQMKATNQGRMTAHTMVFEPAALRLHLAMGPGPATSRALTTIDLAELLDSNPSADE